MVKSSYFSRFFLPLFVGITYLFLYVPIAVLIVYSFNQNALSADWGGFTTHWYFELFESSEVWDALKNSFIVAPDEESSENGILNDPDILIGCQGLNDELISTDMTAIYRDSYKFAESCNNFILNDLSSLTNSVDSNTSPCGTIFNACEFVLNDPLSLLNSSQALIAPKKCDELVSIGMTFDETPFVTGTDENPELTLAFSEKVYGAFKIAEGDIEDGILNSLIHLLNGKHILEQVTATMTTSVFKITSTPTPDHEAEYLNSKLFTILDSGQTIQVL